MILLTDTPWIKRYWFAAMVLVSFMFLTGATWYFTPNPESTPVDTSTGGFGLGGEFPIRGVRLKPSSSENEALRAKIQPIRASLSQYGGFSPASTSALRVVGNLRAKNRVPFTANTTFAPFLDVVPLQDGTGLFISAGGVGELGGTVFANIGIGPGHYKGSTSMVYSGTVYIATIGDFTPNTGASGPLSITTTLGLNSGEVDFNRAYVPASTIQTISSIDGNLQLSVVSTDTMIYDTYIAVVPGFAPPGPPPQGHRLVGSVYSVRAAGTLLTTPEPMSLRIYYNNTILAGADPHTLAILAWDAFNQRWNNLGGTLFSTQQYLSVATSRFTTYALMAPHKVYLPLVLK